MDIATNAPNKPAFRWPGSKYLMAPWIVPFIPSTAEHHTYNEPFAGSAAVLLQKERSPMESINDASGDVTNFFEMLRDQRRLLIRAIKHTPWSTAEYELCRLPADAPLERARRFYLRCWASIRPFDTNPYFRRQKVLSTKNGRASGGMTPAAKQFMRLRHLATISQRLRGVTIENLDACAFMRLYDYERAFFYVDPPYLHDSGNETRKSGRDAYPVEMKSLELHQQLTDVILSLKGMAVISHYACDFYDATYLVAGWQRVDRKVRTDGSGTAVESLYICPKTQAALERDRQRAELAAAPLFRFAGVSL